MCLPVPVPRGVGESRRGVSGGPASPYIALARVGPACPRWPFPEGRHLHVALVHLPTAKGAFRGCTPCLAMASGTMGAPVPTHQRNLLPGHAGSTGSHSVSSIPQESFVSDQAGYRVPQSASGWCSSSVTQGQPVFQMCWRTR